MSKFTTKRTRDGEGEQATLIIVDEKEYGFITMPEDYLYVFKPTAADGLVIHGPRKGDVLEYIGTVLEGGLIPTGKPEGLKDGPWKKYLRGVAKQGLANGTSDEKVTEPKSEPEGEDVVVAMPKPKRTRKRAAS